MLTAKQKDLFRFLTQNIENNNYCPSYDEMKNALNLASKSGIHRLLNSLEERGFIKRLPNRARAIEILKKDFLNSNNSNGKLINLEIIEPINSSVNELIEIPFLGNIAAGTPIEALSENSKTISIPNSMISKGEYFALEIVGDSMIEAGIHDGDTVIIKKANTANSGDIVVALIDEQEATLKKYKLDKNKVALIPANSNYETKFFESTKVRIQGKLTGLIRKYC